MYRQISECIRIRSMQNKGALILNKKEEYSRSILPQLEVSIGGKVLATQMAGITIEGMERSNKKVEEDNTDSKRKIDQDRLSRKRMKLGDDREGDPQQVSMLQTTESIEPAGDREAMERRGVKRKRSRGHGTKKGCREVKEKVNGSEAKQESQAEVGKLWEVRMGEDKGKDHKETRLEIAEIERSSVKDARDQARCARYSQEDEGKMVKEGSLQIMIQEIQGKMRKESTKEDRNSCRRKKTCPDPEKYTHEVKKLRNWLDQDNKPDVGKVLRRVEALTTKSKQTEKFKNQNIKSKTLKKGIPEANKITKYISSKTNMIEFCGTKTTIKKEVDSLAQLNQIKTISLNKSKTQHSLKTI